MTFAIAGVLLAAGLLKLQEPVYLTRSGVPLNREQLLILAAASTEYVLAVWLLSGIVRAWARRATLGVLAVLLTIASFHLARGDPNCGCFGRLSVAPVAPAAFDLTAAILLWYWGRHINLRRSSPIRSRLLAAATAFFVPISILGATTTGVSQANVAVLSAESLLGRKLPLLELLDPKDRADVVRGDCAVILYDPSCAHCREYLNAVARTRGAQWAISILPDAALGAGGFQCPLPELRLKPGAEVITQVPVRLELHNGTVRKVDYAGMAR